MNAETENKLQRLQLLEQQGQNLSSQRQNFQLQLSEINSALTALKGKNEAYKIVGNIMVLTKSEDLNKELNNKLKILTLQISKLEEQEEKITIKAQKLQEEVIKEMGDGDE